MRNSHLSLIQAAAPSAAAKKKSKAIIPSALLWLDNMVEGILGAFQFNLLQTFRVTLIIADDSGKGVNCRQFGQGLHWCPSSLASFVVHNASPACCLTSKAFGNHSVTIWRDICMYI